MIKARAGDLVIFGLSRLNIERLQMGAPIVFDAGVVGLEGTKVMIMYGEDEPEIMRQLNEATSGDKS